jgi:hypothetical protein
LVLCTPNKFDRSDLLAKDFAREFKEQKNFNSSKASLYREIVVNRNENDPFLILMEMKP